MRQIKLILLLASASVTGAFAQNNGLTDMSRSRYARMVNTGIDAVHWTDGFWAERFDVFSRTSLQSMWNTGTRPKYLTVSVILRSLPAFARASTGDHPFTMGTCINGWKE